MILFIKTIVILSTFLLASAEEIRLLDLEPNDAQQYIEKQDTTLKYAPKIESNVPAVRFLGNEPHNVLEDIYLANQYHGQDGLGGYLYGYSVPDIAKTEKKKAGGDLRGAYNYITGDGQEIKVEYWDDGTGFHQTDNVPKILPKQIEDTPEVKAAREEHFRIWQEQAERNSKPVESPYNSQGQYAQGPLSVQGQQQQQQQLSQQYPGQYQQRQQFQGQPQQLVNQYQQQKQQFPNPGQPVQYHGEHGQQTQQVNRYQPANNPQQTQVNRYQQASGQSSGGGLGQHSGITGGQASGQFGGAQGGYQAGAQSGYQASGQYGGGQASGQYGGGQASGQYGGGQASGQYGGGQASGSQYGGNGQQRGGGQHGGNYQSAGQHGGQGDQNQGDQNEGQYDGKDEGQWNEKDEEQQGPPKGFFYSFDYPVGIIVNKDGGGPTQQKRDVKEVYAVNKANFEQQLKRGQLDSRGARSASGYLFIN